MAERTAFRLRPDGNRNPKQTVPLTSESERVVLVDRSRPSERLDTWLRSRVPELSRGAIQRLLEEGFITVNGRPVKPTHSPKAGEEIRVRLPEAKPAEAQPEEIPLEIIYEDDTLLVLNKPSGIVVHPSAGHESSTLVNALLHHCAGGLSGIGGIARPGIVHRLDKDTSGCLVVAKTDETHLALSSQFASRKVEKLYRAIACGEILRESGEIRGAIARDTAHRKRMAVVENSGREAHTSYHVVERLRSSTLIEARLHTGRTHQVRVHMKSIGHPLLGDMTYGSRQNQKLEDETHFVAPRQMLHAAKLGFIHPRSGKRVAFEAPEPADFLDALSALRPLVR